MNTSTIIWIACTLVGFVFAVSWFMHSAAQAQATLLVTSSAFSQGQAIPEKYTCKSENISPALTWRNVPAATKSFAITVDDPDAPNGIRVHWVVYNLPATIQQLPEGADIRQLNGLQGTNSSGGQSYDGPCPPSGTHRYFFKVYALDVVLDMVTGASKDELLNKMKGHVLAQGEIMGTFAR